VPHIAYTTDNDKCEPYKKYRYDAGWDLKSANPTFILKAGEQAEIDTGIKMSIPQGYVGLIMPRSGLGTKHRLGLANTVGVIDSDYRGPIKVHLVNNGDEDLKIEQYSRIVQIMIIPVVLQSMRRVSTLRDTARGSGGFGHTGES